jgi:outer membrane protein assembly factor BamB
MLLAAALAMGPAAAYGAGGSSAPAWVHAIDSKPIVEPLVRGERGANLATDGERVFIVQGGAINALDVRTGAERWRSRAEGFGIPAVTSQIVAAIAISGVVRAFDARTGAERWKSDRLALSLATGASGSRPAVLTSLDHGFFVLSDQQGVAAEIDESGKVLWSAGLTRSDNGRVTAVRDGFVFVCSYEDGAIIHPVLTVFRTGRGGGFSAQVPFALGPLGGEGTQYWALDAFPKGSTSVTIGRFDAGKDVGNVRFVDPWHYTPDAGASMVGYGEAAIEHGFIYAWTHDGEGHDPLYRYRLAPAQGQRPILLSADGVWVAGPYDGRVVVQRPDGLWLLHPHGDRVDTLNVARYAAPVSAQAVAFNGHLVYAALSDGRVVAVDLRNGSRRLEAATPCRVWRGIGVHGDHVLAVCAQRVFAFGLSS